MPTINEFLMEFPWNGLGETSVEWNHSTTNRKLSLQRLVGILHFISKVCIDGKVTIFEIDDLSQTTIHRTRAEGIIGKRN